MKRLFCIPGGGASSVMYMGWKKKLGDLYEVVPLEIPGRGRAADQPCLETVQEIADSLASQICGRTGNEGFAVFGYCYGGIIAYEVCRRLKQKGMPEPENLFICGSAAPLCGTSVVPLLSQKEKRAELKGMLSRFFPPYLISDTDLLEELCVRYMEALFKKYDADGKITPVLAGDMDLEGRVSPEDRIFTYILEFSNTFFENYGRDEASLIRYCAGAKEPFLLDGRVTVICGREDDITGENGGEWQKCCAHPIELVHIDGNHFSLIEDIDVISSVIKRERPDSVSEDLKAIWLKVLNEGQSFAISDETNFFEAGGNSLLLGIMNVLIEKNIGKKLNVELLFKNQTFGAMAAAVRSS